MDAGTEGGWDGIESRVRDQCSGCPRNPTKLPVLFTRDADLSKVNILIVSQEPPNFLRSLGTSGSIENKLRAICKQGTSEELRKVNPLSKVVQMFGPFDPSEGSIYWTHALKCVPVNSDRDINKEWRKAATKCREHLVGEMKVLGKDELNIVAFGKYALEICLNILDGQDIDQELSISETMQSLKLPLVYKYRFKDGTSKNINLFVFTNPSAEVVKIMKSGGKMTTEEIQALEERRLREIVQKKAIR
ncbi:MAG: hypothetical protein LUQ09_03980 [Methanomassiliicoccales archaeon]|nr:hypothetical protein [Methanomassiliicoccales archaeon]